MQREHVLFHGAQHHLAIGAQRFAVLLTAASTRCELEIDLAVGAQIYGGEHTSLS